MSEVQFFLSALFASLPPHAYFYIWHKIDEGHSFCQFFQGPQGISDACKFVEERNNRGNLYIGATASIQALEPYHRPTKEHCAGLVGLWVDVDIAHPCHKKDNLPPDMQTAYSLACSIGPQPSLVVQSGHGLHAWWLFNDFWARTQETAPMMDSLLDAWKKKFQAHPLRFTIDSVWDLARVMRIPGTMNRKDGHEPVLVQIPPYKGMQTTPDGLPLFTLELASRLNRYSVKQCFDCLGLPFHRTQTSVYIEKLLRDVGLCPPDEARPPVPTPVTLPPSPPVGIPSALPVMLPQALPPVSPASVPSVPMGTLPPSPPMGIPSALPAMPPQALPPVPPASVPSVPMGTLPLSPPVTASSIGTAMTLPISPVATPTLTLDPNASLNQEAFDKLYRENERFRLSWERHRIDLKDSSPSGYDFSLAGFTVRAGWSDQEIVNMLIVHRRKHNSDLKLDNRQYYERTLANVRKAAASENEGKTAKIRIDLNSTQTEEVVDRIRQTLIEHQQQEALFRHIGLGLVRIEPDLDTGRPIIVPVEAPELAGHVMKYIDFVRTGEKHTSLAAPPSDCINLLISRPAAEFPLRIVRRIVDSPVLLEDGSILTHPGYHAASRLYYGPQPGFEIPPLPEYPTVEDIKQARQWIEEMLCDFPFKDEPSRTNCIALFLTPILRDWLPTVPLALFNAPDRGTGKTLLSNIAGELATGTSPYQSPGFPKSDDELRKILTSAAMGGYYIVIFDNVESVIKSAVLASALTSPFWTDRKLSTNKLFQGKQQNTWLATGNNLHVSEDFERRIYEIHLDAKVERPWERRDFRHPDIKRWVHDNRGQLIRALSNLIRAWVVAGRPLFKDVVLGSFERWTETVGGILVNGGYQGFLANLNTTRDRMASEENDDWKAFFEAILRYKQGASFTAKEISGIVISGEVTSICDTLPSSLRLTFQKNPMGVLGSFFSRHQGQRFTIGEGLYYLEGSEKLIHGIRLWSFKSQ